MSTQPVKKILVVRFSSLGDILLTSPLLKKIKNSYPGSEIHYLTKQSFIDLIKFNPAINKITPADNELTFKKLRHLKKIIKSENYDLIIDAHNNLRTFYLKLFSNSPRLIFKKYSLRKLLLVYFKINLMKLLPSVAERYCNIIAGENPSYIPEIFSSTDSQSKVIQILNTLPSGKKLICIAPSSAHFTKTYPAEYYIELINKMGNDYIFLLVGKGKDKKSIEQIKSQTGENVIDLCDKLTILELAEIIKRSNFFISGDTGPMHIAEAMGKNLVMIAGSSVREFGFYPQNKNSAVLENNTLLCRPCSHIGRSKCPLGHFKCMREIKPERIIEAICSQTTSAGT